MTDTDPIPTAAVVICVVTLVLATVQVFRYSSRQEIWNLCSNWNTWTSWSRWTLWTRWSVSQVLCYIAVLVASLIWLKVASASHVVLQCLLHVSWLISTSGQSMILHRIFCAGGMVLLYLWSSLAILINIAGFALMQRSKTYHAKTYMAGCGLIYGSAVIYYATQAAAVIRLQVPPKNQHPRYIMFRFVLVIVTIGVAATGLFAVLKAKEYLPLAVSIAGFCANLSLTTLAFVGRSLNLARNEVSLSSHPSKEKMSAMEQGRAPDQSSVASSCASTQTSETKEPQSLWD